MKFENIFNEIAEQYYNAIYKYCCVRLDNEHAANDDLDETTEDSYSVETPFEDIISKDEYKLLDDYYIKGEDIGHISKKLGISKAAVSQRIHRIKAKIEKKYMQ